MPRTQQLANIGSRRLHSMSTGGEEVEKFWGRVRGFYHNSFSASMRFSTWARNACRSVSPTCTIDHFETRRPGGMTMQISTLFVALRVIA